MTICVRFVLDGTMGIKDKSQDVGYLPRGKQYLLSINYATFLYEFIRGVVQFEGFFIGWGFDINMARRISNMYRYLPRIETVFRSLGAVRHSYNLGSE